MTPCPSHSLTNAITPLFHFTFHQTSYEGIFLFLAKCFHLYGHHPAATHHTSFPGHRVQRVAMATARQIPAQAIGLLKSLQYANLTRKTSYQTAMTTLASRLSLRQTACAAFTKLFLFYKVTTIGIAKHACVCLSVTTFLSNVTSHLSDYTVSQPRRLQYERSPPLKLQNLN